MICIFQSLEQGKMETIIKITENNGKKAVSARELYFSLGYEKGQYARWYKKTILENPYSIESIDYQGFDINVEGNETKDFALTLDFAKKICMISKTKVGEQVRNYFIEVEKQSTQLVPTNFKEALMLALKLEEEKEQLALEVATQKPYVMAFNRVIESATTYTLDTLSDIVNVGRTKLSEMLKTMNWAMKDSSKGTSSTRYAEELGYAKTLFDIKIMNGKEIPIKKIVLTRKGLDKLVTILNQ